MKDLQEHCAAPGEYKVSVLEANLSGNDQEEPLLL